MVEFEILEFATGENADLVLFPVSVKGNGAC